MTTPVTYPIDNDIAAGDTGHIEHHEILANSANDHETRIETLEAGGGGGTVDLSNYYTKAETDSQISTSESGLLSQANADARYARTVNLQPIDATGNVTVDAVHVEGAATQDDLTTTIQTAPALIDGTSGTLPNRASVTSDTTRKAFWLSPTAPPAGGGFALENDVWFKTP